MKFTSIRLSLAALALVTLATSAQAGLQGAQVDVTYLYPDASTVYQDLGVTTIDGSVEYTNVLGDFNLQLTDTQLIWTATTFDSSFNPSTFNGLQLTLLNGATFTSAVYDPATTLYPTQGYFSSTQLWLNFQGLSFTVGQQTVVDWNGTTTPSPAAALPMLGGLVGLARRRFRK